MNKNGSSAFHEWLLSFSAQENPSFSRMSVSERGAYMLFIHTEYGSVLYQASISEPFGKLKKAEVLLSNHDPLQTRAGRGGGGTGYYRQEVLRHASFFCRYGDQYLTLETITFFSGMLPPLF